MNYLSDEQLEAVLRKLVRLSEKKILNWEQDPFRSNPTSFNCVQGDFFYEVKTTDGDEYAPYTFEIHRAGTGTSAPLAVVDSDEAAQSLSALVENLYQEAQRKALGLEHLAESIIKSLDLLDPDA